MKKTTYRPGIVHQTTNYSMFKVNKKNRGLKNGIDKKRTQYFINQYDSGNYIHGYGVIWVNLNFELIDGHHKLEILQELELPVRFIVLDDIQVNPNTKSTKEYYREIGAITADINNKNSSWTTNQHFECALSYNYPLAIEIRKYQKTISKNGFLMKTIPTNHIYGIVKNDCTYFSAGSKAVVRDYGNETDIHNAKSDNVINAVNFYIEVRKALVNKYEPAVLNKLLNLIFRAYWNVDKITFFDADKFLNALNRYEGNKLTGTKNELKTIVEKLYNNEFSKGRKSKYQLFK